MIEKDSFHVHQYPGKKIAFVDRTKMLEVQQGDDQLLLPPRSCRPDSIRACSVKEQGFTNSAANSLKYVPHKQKV